MKSAAEAKEKVSSLQSPRSSRLTHCAQGNAAFKSGAFADALKHYTAAISLKADEPTFYLNRAAVYLKLARWALLPSAARPASRSDRNQPLTRRVAQMEGRRGGRDEDDRACADEHEGAVQESGREKGARRVGGGKAR